MRAMKILVYKEIRALTQCNVILITRFLTQCNVILITRFPSVCDQIHALIHAGAFSTWIIKIGNERNNIRASM